LNHWSMRGNRVAYIYSENLKKGIMARKVSWKKDKRLQRILKQNAERRAEEWYKQNKGLDIAVTIVIAVGFILGLIVVVVAGIAGLLLALVVIIISAFSISSMFKG